MKILVTPTSLCKNEALLGKLAEKGELVLNTTGKPLTEEQLIPLVGDIDGYLAGLDMITAAVLEKAPKLKAISRYGVGYERVDLETAGRLGIPVTNTPGANTQSVADLAFALMLACARKVTTLNSAVKAGGWSRENGKQIFGKTLGIVGLGAIGKALALRGKNFSMEIKAYDPYMDTAWAEANDVNVCTLDEVLEGSDVISLHIPHTPETHNIINRERMEAMRDGVILINTSRGGLIDEDAAFDYIENGKIYGIGLDAFETEPPVPHRLYSLDNVILTPHAGAHTGEAVEGMATMSVDNLLALLDNTGKADHCIVNKKFLVEK